VKSVDKFTFPLSVDDLVKVIVNVACHESGHMLGLVSNALGGISDHNHPPPGQFDPCHIMNVGVPLNWYFDVDLKGNEAIRVCNPLNLNYLKWLLPKP